MSAPLQLTASVPGALSAFALRSLPLGGEKQKKRPIKGDPYDPYGRTGRAQVLHIELWYADGTKGEINLLSPHIAWGSDIESQWRFMREYLHKEHGALGIIRYHAHCAHVRENGALKISWSWFAFDLILNQEVR